MFNKIVFVCGIGAFFVSCGGGGGGGGTTSPAGGGGTPPQVVTTSPANGANNIPVNVIITVKFTKLMDLSTFIINSSFIVTDGFTNVTSGTFTQDTVNFIVSFDGQFDLSANTTYQVTLTTGIKDSEGISLANPVQFTFMTQANADTTAPVFGGATSATAMNAKTVTVNWTAATDNVTPQGSIVYKVWKSTVSGGQNFGAAPDAVSNPGATQVNVSGLTQNTTYFFVVRAFDEAGNFDTNTTEQVVSTPALKSWVTDVFNPIIVGKGCTAGLCHGGGAGGLLMTDSTTAYNNLVNVNAQCAGLPAGTKRVLPSDAINSFMFKKVAPASSTLPS